MKREKLVAIIGLCIFISSGIAIIISIVILSDMINPLTSYEFYAGLAMIVLPSIFLLDILLKKKRGPEKSKIK